jgi:phage/plasmid-like protein (TIGR03299 family)
MAHQLTTRKDKFTEMAFTGKRSEIWHGLGQEMADDCSIETWMTQAGMDWNIQSSPVLFNAEFTRTVPNKRVLYRSDTKEALSVVSDNFKIVQPAEILEFFRDLTEFHGLKLSTAGTLFGGRKFWALAETGLDESVIGDDKVKANVMLVTSCDGSLATTAKFVSTRVVCNNTLTIALAESSKSCIKVSHKSDFDPKAVKMDMGLIEKSWYNFMAQMRGLTEIKMTPTETQSFLFQNLTKDKSEPTKMEVDTIQSILDLVKNGAGHESGAGTAWNLLNGVTEFYTHFKNSNNQEVNFWNDISGAKDQTKTDIFQKLVALA